MKPPCEESVTLAIVRSPLFGEILDALRDDDAVGMLLRVDALETQFASHPVLHYFRGVAYEVLGDADEAHTCYLTAVRGAVAELAKDVNDGFTLDRLQWVACYGSERLAAGFSIKGRQIAAETVIQRLPPVGTHMHHAWMALARVRATFGDHNGALEFLYRSYESNPEVETLVAIADGHRAIHHTDEALRAYQLLTADSPERADGWAGVGECLVRRGRFREAAEAFRRAVAIVGVTDARMLNTYAYALCECGKPRKATRYASAAIRLRPTSPAAWDTLAKAHIGAHQYDRAIKAALKAIALNWDEHEAWFHLGQAHARAGNLMKAGEILERLKRVDIGWAGLLAGEVTSVPAL